MAQYDRTKTISRRTYLSLAGAGAGGLVAGCTGSDSDPVIVSVTATDPSSETDSVELDTGARYELTLSLEEGTYAYAGLAAYDAPDDDHEVELEEPGERSVEFSPDHDEYLVSVGVRPSGSEATATLREAQS